MNILTVIMAVFSLLGGIDRIIGNRFGLGKEFERAFNLLGSMALSMVGMLILGPGIADFIRPITLFISENLPIDASVIPASLFANDMGGASLSIALADDEKIGFYHALVVSSMMGCTISFTIPYSLSVVKKSHYKNLFFGILCGIVVTPIGCFAGGLVCGVPISALIINLIPLAVFSVIIEIGLFKFTEICNKIFGWFAVFMRGLITAGLLIGALSYLFEIEIFKNAEEIKYGAEIIFNAAVVLSGTFPLVAVINKVLEKPIKAISKKSGMSKLGVVGLITCLASNAASFELVNDMEDGRDVALNSALAATAAFGIGGHLAFTMAINADYIWAMLVGKFVAGALSLVLTALLYNLRKKAE